MSNEPLAELKLKELRPEFPKVFRNICCPSCDNDVKANDLNIQDKIAKCSSCHVVFPFYEEINDFFNPKPTREIARPEGIEVYQFKNEMDIAIKQPMTPLEGLGAFLGPLFAVMFFGIYASGNSFMLFPSIACLLISIYSIYLMVNRSNHFINININSKELSLQWLPKKMMPNKTFNVDEIDQVYIKQGHFIYLIVNTAEGQKHVKLLTLTSLPKASYLEQEIERQLGIKDRVVQGEIPK